MYVEGVNLVMNLTSFPLSNVSPPLTEIKAGPKQFEIFKLMKKKEVSSAEALWRVNIIGTWVSNIFAARAWTHNLLVALASG